MSGSDVLYYWLFISVCIFVFMFLCSLLMDIRKTNFKDSNSIVSFLFSFLSDLFVCPVFAIFWPFYAATIVLILIGIALVISFLVVLIVVGGLFVIAFIITGGLSAVGVIISGLLGMMIEGKKS